MVENPAYDYDDEIDLREIVLTLWKGRWLILALTLIAALLAYAVSAWLLPRQYQATAYITIGQPQVRYTSANSLLFLPATPDIRALPELLMAEAVLEQVAGDPRVAPLLASDEARLTGKMQVDMLGATQLRFQVTDTDAERAATLANVWAEKAADWTESAYGLGALTATLDAQISQTQQAYVQAQSALETFLAEDQTPILQSLLTAKSETYICLEERVSASNATLERLEDMEKCLAQTDAFLSSDASLMASIQQETDALFVACSDSGMIIPSQSIAVFADLDASEALQMISTFRERVQQLVTSARREQTILQDEILQLSVEIERMEHQQNEYTSQRDQAKTLYEQLAYQQILMDNVLQQSGRVAQVSVEATAPQRPSSPRPAVNAALTGMSMAVLVGAIVLLRATWSKPK